jgi:CoA:oxalate CoA-transferase
MSSCLEGVKVIEFSEGWRATPLAGRLLAELGAEVVKVEVGETDPLWESLPKIEGTDQSYRFALLHCNKKSIKVPSLNPRVEQLIEESDVVLIDVPAAREKGIYEQLVQSSSQRINCCISPFGLTGPRSAYVGSDFVVQAASGIMATTGEAGGEPMRVGVPFAEHVGALFAAIGVLGALEYRRRTGKGQVIDISMQDALVSYLSTFAPQVFLMGKKPTRMGNRHPIAVPWNVYRTSDGWVTICALTDKMWVSLVQAMGRDELLQEPQYASQALRSQNRDAVEAIVGQWAAGRTVQQVVEALDAAEVPVANIQTIDSLLTDEQFCERQMVVRLPGPQAGQEVVATGSVFTLSACPGRVSQLGPVPGQDNAEYGIEE